MVNKEGINFNVPNLLSKKKGFKFKIKEFFYRCLYNINKKFFKDQIYLLSEQYVYTNKWCKIILKM